ncbi:MAG: hypothetical protein ACI8TP_003232 [Acidimicrobiales bacterium]|jgi:hypothetical protein
MTEPEAMQMTEPEAMQMTEPEATQRHGAGGDVVRRPVCPGTGSKLRVLNQQRR